MSGHRAFRNKPPSSPEEAERWKKARRELHRELAEYAVLTDSEAWVLWLAAERGELRIPELP